ncbi:MAG: YaiO family outer membrane beta-barrel protein, partial [Flavobacterium sp.]
NLKKGWETDLGIRLIKAQTLDIVTLATGVSKYSGSYWWSLSAYLNNVKKNYNPVFILNTRYYLNSKYDYFTANLGFGTSPDERATIALLQNRLSLNSIRIGGGFYKIFQNKIITGVQLNYNYQEYFPEKYQNEYQMSLVVHYKI